MSYTKIFAYLRGQKAFTAFLTTLIVIGSLSAAFAGTRAEAEVVLLNVTDTLSTSDPSVLSKHTFTFTPVNTITGSIPGENVDITFPAGFTVPALVFGDISMASSSAYTPVAACAAGAGNIAVTVASQVVTIKLCQNSSLAAGVPVTLTLGTGATKLTNPTVGSYEIAIRNVTTLQSQKLRVMILSKVLMTAAVDPILQFVVTGTSTGIAVNGTTTSTTTSATAIDFGKLNINTAYVAAQQLDVSTNARNGFTVTAQTDSEFKSANGATIDGFNFGGASSTASAWAIPTGTVGNDRTWGHVAITTSDLTNTLPSIASNFWVGNFIQNPVTVMSEASSTRNQKTMIGYEVMITDLQEAATDYKTNIIYVATPVF